MWGPTDVHCNWVQCSSLPTVSFPDMELSINGGTTQIINCNEIFHYKPYPFGAPPFVENPVNNPLTIINHQHEPLFNHYWLFTTYQPYIFTIYFVEPQPGLDRSAIAPPSSGKRRRTAVPPAPRRSSHGASRGIGRSSRTTKRPTKSTEPWFIMFIQI